MVLLSHIIHNYMGLFGALKVSGLMPQLHHFFLFDQKIYCLTAEHCNDDTVCYSRAASHLEKSAILNDYKRNLW